MKLDRLVSILVLLLRKGRMQARELAEIFEVSVRTIHRDIEAINLAGIPIVTYQGANGGIGIAEGYRLDKSVLTEDEMSTIISTLGGISKTMPDKRYEILVEKLKSTIPSSQLQSMDSRVRELIIDLYPWGSGKMLKEAIAGIKKAIKNHRLIEFTYIDFEMKKTSRTVEPYSLILKGQKWYLYAWCRVRQDYRLFKLSRIRNLVVLDTVFEPRDVNTSQLDFDKEWNMPVPVVDLQLLFEKELENLVIEFYGDGFERREDGKLMVNLTLPENPWLYGYILSFGLGVTVVSPPHIKKIIAEISKGIYEKYSCET